jgi:hypothetical protein
MSGERRGARLKRCPVPYNGNERDVMKMLDRL